MKCTVKSGDKVFNETGYLQVFVRPSVLLAPSVLVIKEYEDGVLSCHLHNTDQHPDIEITWCKDNVPFIPGSLVFQLFIFFKQCFMLHNFV